MSNINTVSAKTVRAYFKARPDKVASLATDKVSVDDLMKNLNGRGRPHPLLAKGYRSATRGVKEYTVHVSDNKRVNVRGPKGKVFTFDTSTLRKIDGTTGNRGRISEATKAKALEMALAGTLPE